MPYQPIFVLPTKPEPSLPAQDWLNYINPPFGAYLPGAPIYYTSDGTFTKGQFPGLRAVLVRAVGGGGAGGGTVATGAGTIAAGAGGGGGAYVESLVLAADLDATEAVTVGQGGTGVSGAQGNDGTDSVFDTISGEVRAARAGGGGVGAAVAPNNISSGGGGTGGNQTNSTGDLECIGSDGGIGICLAVGRGGFGGAPAGLGGSSRPTNSSTSAGQGGKPYGGGGSGAAAATSQPAQTGGAGADGIVIVTPLY